MSVEIGKRYGKLVIIRKVRDNRQTGNHADWLCKCDCGNEKVISTRDLSRKEFTKSCGCARKRESKYKINIGDIFGKWKVDSVSEQGPSKFVCKCECGNMSILKAKDLYAGRSKSCANCARGFKSLSGKKFGTILVKEYLGRSRWKCKCDCGDDLILYSNSAIRGTHRKCSLKYNPLKKKYSSMFHSIKQRCLNPDDPNYFRYGGRGISLYSDWVDNPENFYLYIDSALGDKPAQNYSLDRIDNDRGYEPGNLRWASKKEQAANRRTPTKMEKINMALVVLILSVLKK